MQKVKRSAKSGRILAGAVEVCITPRLPVNLAGYFNVRKAGQVRDDLHCRACVVRSGKWVVAWVSFDLMAIPAALVRSIRSEVVEQTGRRNFACMVGVTHTHSGPAPVTVFSDVPDPKYIAEVRQAATDAVVTAFRTAVPARLGAGSGKETTTVFNRRFLMRDGNIKTNPGVGNPDIVRPAGPVDPEVGILKAVDANGKPIAAIVNFSNHADTLGLGQVSADWPGAMVRQIKKALGRHIVTPVLLGAAGDINHVNVKSRGTVFGPRMTEKVGTAVAKAVLAMWHKITTRDHLALAAVSKTVSFPRKQMPKEELARARELLRGVKLPFRRCQDLDPFDLARGNRGVEKLFAKELLALAKLHRRQECGELQAIAVGDAAFVAAPGELFVEMGLAIKKASPFRKTFVVGLANGYLGYMPTDEAQRRGGYESRPARSSRLGLGTEGIVVSNALELLRKLKQRV